MCRPSKSQQTHNVEKKVDSTLIQRLDVESTLNRRCFNVVPAGMFVIWSYIRIEGETVFSAFL